MHPVTKNEQLRASCLLALLVLICHGPLLINGGVYVDGWPLYGFYLNHDTRTMHVVYGQIGIPFLEYFNLAFWSASDPIFAYKLVAFICILFSTISVYFLAWRPCILTSRECLFIAGFFCCYTAYQLHVEIDVLQYTFCYTLFLLSAWLAAHAVTVDDKRGLFMRILSLAVFFISFQTASLLVFYFAFLIFLAIEHRRSWASGDLRTAARLSLRYWDFVLLPIAYWALRTTVFKPYGTYAQGNVLHFDPTRWPELFRLYWENAICYQFSNSLPILGSLPKHSRFLASLIIIGIFVAAFFRSRRPLPGSDGDIGALAAARRECFVAFCITLYSSVMLLCAIAPYILVNKFPQCDGFSTRHALLLNLPIALGLVGLGRVPLLVLPQRMTSRIINLIAGLLIGAFALSTLRIYEEYQSRWIKDLSVIANLRKLPKTTIDKVRIFVVSDPDRIGSEIYRFYEYAGMFKLAWSEERWVGVESSGQTPAAAADGLEPTLRSIKSDQTYPMYLLKDLPTNGCRVVLNIRLNMPERKRLILSYFRMLWFHPDGLQAFLEGVTTLGLTDLSCPNGKIPRS